jgi:hypothetical protein
MSLASLFGLVINFEGEVRSLPETPEIYFARVSSDLTFKH